MTGVASGLAANGLRPIILSLHLIQQDVLSKLDWISAIQIFL